jgi:hypothetical protein
MALGWNAQCSERLPRLYDVNDEDDEYNEPTCERVISREDIDAMMREAERAEREASGFQRVSPRDTQPDLNPLGLQHREEEAPPSAPQNVEDLERAFAESILAASAVRPMPKAIPVPIPPPPAGPVVLPPELRRTSRWTILSVLFLALGALGALALKILGHL